MAHGHPRKNQNELKQQPGKAKCPEVVVKVLVVLIC